MGIPKFFRWAGDRYPAILSGIIGDEEEFPFSDVFLIDLNGLIHQASHNNDSVLQSAKSVEVVLQNLCNTIDYYVTEIVKPQMVLYIAVDGVAPRAKLNQQRARRFRSSHEQARQLTQARLKSPTITENELFDSNVITPGTSFMTAIGEGIRSFIAQRMREHPLWQQLEVIFSGSDVPGEGEHKLISYIRDTRAQGNKFPANTRYVIYGADADMIMLALATHEPYILILREIFVIDRNAKKSSAGDAGGYAKRRNKRLETSNDSNTNDPTTMTTTTAAAVAAIVGGETLVFPTDVAKIEDELALEPEPVAAIDPAVSEPTEQPMEYKKLQFIRIHTLRECLIHEFSEDLLDIHLHTNNTSNNLLEDLNADEEEEDEYDLNSSPESSPKKQQAKQPKRKQSKLNDGERFIDDFIFLTFLIGNDFLPHLPGIDIGDQAFDILFDAYKTAYASEPGYLILAEEDDDLEEGQESIDYGRLELIFTLIGVVEEVVYQEQQIARASRQQARPYYNGGRGRGGRGRGGGYRGGRNGGGRGQEVGLQVQRATSDGSTASMLSNTSNNTMAGTASDGDQESVFSQPITASAPSTTAQSYHKALSAKEYRLLYYHHKFHLDLTIAPAAANTASCTADDQLLYPIIKEYLTGLTWCLAYYRQGVPSWSWYYPYHYGLFLSDMKYLPEIAREIQLPLDAPLTPFQQLLACLPVASIERCLPPLYGEIVKRRSRPPRTMAKSTSSTEEAAAAQEQTQEQQPVMIDEQVKEAEEEEEEEEESAVAAISAAVEGDIVEGEEEEYYYDLSSFYPSELITDLNGKKNDYEAVVLLPFLDINRLIACEEHALKQAKAAQLEGQLLTEAELARNTRQGHSYRFLYTRQMSLQIEQVNASGMTLTLQPSSLAPGRPFQPCLLPGTLPSLPGYPSLLEIRTQQLFNNKKGSHGGGGKTMYFVGKNGKLGSAASQGQGAGNSGGSGGSGGGKSSGRGGVSNRQMRRNEESQAAKKAATTAADKDGGSNGNGNGHPTSNRTTTHRSNCYDDNNNDHGSTAVQAAAVEDTSATAVAAPPQPAYENYNTRRRRNRNAQEQQRKLNNKPTVVKYTAFPMPGWTMMPALSSYATNTNGTAIAADDGKDSSSSNSSSLLLGVPTMLVAPQQLGYQLTVHYLLDGNSDQFLSAVALQIQQTTTFVALCQINEYHQQQQQQSRTEAATSSMMTMMNDYSKISLEMHTWLAYTSSTAPSPAKAALSMKKEKNNSCQELLGLLQQMAATFPTIRGRFLPQAIAIPVLLNDTRLMMVGIVIEDSYQQLAQMEQYLHDHLLAAEQEQVDGEEQDGVPAFIPRMIILGQFTGAESLLPSFLASLSQELNKFSSHFPEFTCSTMEVIGQDESQQEIDCHLSLTG